MKLAYLLIFIFVGVLIITAKLVFNQSDIQPSQNSQPVETFSFIIKGSIPYWDQAKAFTSFKENIEHFGYVNLFWYFLTKEGQIQKYAIAYENQEIVSFAHTNNVGVLAVITNLPEQEDSNWDSERVEEMLKDSSTQEKHIQDIIDNIERLNFDGVTIDYEEVDYRQKDKFSQFIKRLSESLHQKGKILSLALHPKTQGDQGNGRFQDWTELSKYADQLNIMAYGEHYDESGAGPIASIGWVKQIIEYTRSLGVPLYKFYLGIPLYGYDWNTDHGQEAQGLTYAGVQDLLNQKDSKISWDTNSQSPYFEYEEDGDKREVWFENSDSVLEKIRLARGAPFAGISFWRLGGEDPKIWEKLTE